MLVKDNKINTFTIQLVLSLLGSSIVYFNVLYQFLIKEINDAILLTTVCIQISNLIIYLKLKKTEKNEKAVK